MTPGLSTNLGKLFTFSEFQIIYLKEKKEV